MKISRLTLGCLLALAATHTLTAKTWEERAAERFKKPVSEEEKQKITDSLPAQPRVKPRKERRILVISRCEGFIHTSIPHGKFMLEQMGKKTGAFSVEFDDRYEAFTSANLAKYDAILFNNTTNLTPDPDQQKAIMDFVNNGKAIIGIHAATDNFSKWHEGLCMMGGLFNGHPWNANGNWAFQLDDARHPINRVFEGKGFWHTDEIYQYKPDSFQGPEILRILVSLDIGHDHNFEALENYEKKKRKGELSEDEVAKLRKEARDVPVSWIRTVGKGRLFYTNFGHREDTNWNPKINQHILDGIQYALGDLEADDTPTADAKDLLIAPPPAKPGE